MDSEASTSSSPLATDLSKINATSAHKKRKATHHRGGARPRSNPEMVTLALHGAAGKLNSAPCPTRAASSAHADIQMVAPASLHNSGGYSLRVDTENNALSLVCVNVDAEEFVDEEAMFNMPMLLDCMAQGMLLTPPALKKGFSWTQNADDHHMDLTLWGD